ncbi:MAG: hypothetical protein IAI48_00410 [Candidatus Eremiobacteraeota bacterium]|nr:hypothetical protein [Candidatus Eremiobacteraeota bacterium]
MSALASVVWLKCIECGGEGGWFDHRSLPADWVRCFKCFGFGICSSALDAWFATRTS